MLYIQHSKTTLYNFIPILSWSTSPLCPPAIPLQFFTQLSLSIISKCPNHLSLPPLLTLCLPTDPKQSLKLSEDFSILQCRITQPPYHVISLQLCQVLFFHCPGLTTIESNIFDTCLATFLFIENTLEVRGKISLNFFEPHLGQNYN